MNGFKRLCLFVFSLSGLLALAALALTWVGPWTTQARSMLEVRWYFITLEVLVCIAAVGLLLVLLRSLFAPSNPRESIVADVPGGQIIVTRQAVISQTKHIIERDGTCIASTIKVKLRKRGNVRVAVRVKPRQPVDVVAHGEYLYDALGKGLAMVCGDSLKSLEIVFTEPEQMGTLTTHIDSTPAGESVTIPASSLSMYVDNKGPLASVVDERLVGRGAAQGEQAEQAEPAAEPTVESEPVASTDDIMANAADLATTEEA